MNGSAGSGVLHAECATWLRPLDPDEPGGAEIEIRVARIPSTAIDPAADAMTFINGGPGGSSIDLLVDFGGAIRAFTRERDVVVLDQRGTGRSTPMSCEALADATETPERDEIGPLTRECLESLPHDPRFFSTSVAVRDLEALRAELGYAQLSLYGVSYGTRVALHFLRRYPESVRALVLDGVVPPQIVLGSNVALNSENTLRRVFAMCAEDARCSERFPELETEFAQLAARLKADPVPMALAHPVTGDPTELELTYGHLAIMLRLALYGPELRSLIPLIIHDAVHKENYTPIAANALQLIHQLTTTMAYGMHNAVVCTEDAPFYSDVEVDREALEATYLGADMYNTLAAMCEVWPRGKIDDGFKTPVAGDVPTLILSGELDPITPPRYGDQLLADLRNAKHVVGKAQGHGILVRGCMAKVVLEFVEAASSAELDTSCTEHLGARPFFINRMGPAP